MNYSIGFEAFPVRPGAYRVVLEPRQEGVYINVIETAEADEPYIDLLAPSLQGAMFACKEDYGVEESDWKQIPNPPWH